MQGSRNSDIAWHRKLSWPATETNGRLSLIHLGRLRATGPAVGRAAGSGSNMPPALRGGGATGGHLSVARSGVCKPVGGCLLGLCNAGGGFCELVCGVPTEERVGMGLRRWLSVVFGAGLVFVGLPATALAAPPDPSAVIVGDTQLAPGDTFDITFELFNADVSTIIAAKAQLRTLEAPATSLFDLVSCSVACGAVGESFRAGVGDLPSGESRTVVFTFQVKANAPGGAYTLEHQFVGDNFSFGPVNGPVLTITPQAADLDVSLDASPRGILTSRVTYTVEVANLGPGDASSVRVEGNYAAGFSWAGGNGCVRTSGRHVQCDFSAIAAGDTASASFSVNAGLLAIGSFTTTVSRSSSTPSDPVSSNDSASRSCAALTGLLVRC